MTYDDDGFLLTKSKPGVPTQTLSWNDLGQLTQVVTNGVTTTYGYDGWGRRVRKTVNGTATGYLHDGDQVVVEVDANRQPVVEYTYYPGIDRPHSMRRGGQTYYYAQDAQGNVTGLISATGTLAARYEYTPFGETITASGSVTNAVQFKGREYDAESGLYFMRARYYDPHLGRFSSQDPIGLRGGINPYVFADNNPVANADPLGLCPYDYGQAEPPNMDTMDCPKNEVGDGLRYLQRFGGGVGDRIIREILNLGLSPALFQATMSEAIFQTGRDGYYSRGEGSDPTQFFIRQGISPQRAAYVIAHEVGHVLSRDCTNGYMMETDLYESMTSPHRYEGPSNAQRLARRERKDRPGLIRANDLESGCQPTRWY
jgi:RHS repeat-associated protein